jgi:lambda family phage portal protein
MSFVDSIASTFGYVRKGSVRRAGPPPQKRNIGGASTDRLFTDWNASTSSKNDKIQNGFQLRRARSRDLAESNEYATAFLTRCKTNIVGPNGIPMRNRSYDFNGKGEKILDKRANAIIDEAWQDWCKAENCTVTGELSFNEVLNLIVETEPQDGEFLGRIVRDFPDNEFRFALQMLETDCLDETFNVKLPGGGTIRMGVERNAWKRPVAYHIKKENPNDMLGYLGASLERTRVSADQIIHKFIKHAPNQVRGIPWLVPAMEGMHMLAAYDEASVVAARNGACKGGFWKPMPNGTGDYVEDEDVDGNLTQEVSPGQIDIAKPGYDFVPYDPTYPHEQYPQFVKAQLRKIASALCVSYNGLANDLEGVNYSSIRAGLLDERDVWKLLQAALKQSVCERIFKDWLEEMLLTQRINLPLSKLIKFNRPKFVPRGWPWVDPSNDIEANIKAIKNRLTSHSQVVSENGGDFEETLQSQEQDEKDAGARGISLDDESDAMKANTLGVHVRAGLITPQMEDEEKMREEVGMPPLSAEAKAAWAKDKVRRPITLQSQEGFENAQQALKAPATPPAAPAKKAAE